jgi:hypothetical protein
MELNGMEWNGTLTITLFLFLFSYNLNYSEGINKSSLVKENFWSGLPFATGGGGDKKKSVRGGGERKGGFRCSKHRAVLLSWAGTPFENAPRLPSCCGLLRV